MFTDVASNYEGAPLSDEDRQLADFGREPTLVLFSGAVELACGFAQSADGPCYCPVDEKVYIDPSFFRDLRDRSGAPGDFAQAYVIAHEVGHHVQNQLGIMEQVHSAQQQAGSQVDSNSLSLMLELQADCFVEAWAQNADRSSDILEHGDIEKELLMPRAA